MMNFIFVTPNGKFLQLGFYFLFLICLPFLTSTFDMCTKPSLVSMKTSLDYDLNQSQISSRRQFISTLTLSSSVAIFSGLPSRCLATTTGNKFDSYPAQELEEMVAKARKELDKCNSLIKDSKWDSVRTILKQQPLAEIPKVIVSLAKNYPDEEEIILGYKNDAAFHLQMLDTFVYNNVFVGEDRQILGTKIDFATPLDELSQSKEALDNILEIIE